MSEQGQVSTRDMEQLSAYLDGRLERSEAARLEARLSQDSQLRLELQELRATVRVLSSLPRIRPPRSFTLQPQAVGRHTGYPFLQLGTALATLSFLVVVGADLLVSRGAQPTQIADRLLAAPAAQPEAAAEVPALDQSLGLTPEGTPAAEAVGAAQGETDEFAQAQAESPAPTGTAQPETSKYRAGEVETAEPAAGEPAAAASDADATPAAPEPGREAELQAGAELPPASEPQELTTTEPVSSRRSAFLRAAEIGLGATALVLGVLTVRARRRA
ncbi:MAG TPA: hypothetical protein VIH26_06310 [Anaerolineales bacterium]